MEGRKNRRRCNSSLVDFSLRTSSSQVRSLLRTVLCCMCSHSCSRLSSLPNARGSSLFSPLTPVSFSHLVTRETENVFSLLISCVSVATNPYDYNPGRRGEMRHDDDVFSTRLFITSLGIVLLPSTRSLSLSFFHFDSSVVCLLLLIK
jgi:hypothetical protein